MKIVVIGAGPAGEAAAKAAAKLKAEVLVIEKEHAGGLCLNHGCIPSKALLASVKKLHDLKRVEILDQGFIENIHKDDLWHRFQGHKNKIIGELRAAIESSFKLHGVKSLKGTAQFISDHEISVDGKTEAFDKCIIAVGSEVFFPGPLANVRDQILDSNKVLELGTLPENIVIIGGGAVGCEFACLLSELGVKVTIIEKTAGLIPGEEENVAAALKKSYEERGIRIFLSTTVEGLKKARDSWQMVLSNQQILEAQEILACVGRRPNGAGLNLEAANVKYSPAGIEVNASLQTSNPNIYAVGDVNGKSLLAHAGSRQGEIAAANALGQAETYEDALIPRCLYTWPEVASVGIHKAEAEKRGLKAKAQRFFFKGSSRALAERETEGFIQITSETETGTILGAQIIGPHATELLHVFSVALYKKTTILELRQVIFAHPTLAEGIREASLR